MEKKSKKFLVLTIVLSISLNLIFAINYFVEKQNKKIELIEAVESILNRIHYADSLLNDGDDSTSDYEKWIMLAAFEITKSRSLVDTHEKDLPPNLVSWIGDVELGLRSGALEANESSFRRTAQNLKNFNDGVEKEVQNLHNGKNHTEILKIVEDVLSSQEYMGNNYISK
ncbi:hypothetical protein MHZ95_07275 [Sporosarcina sp. ACRSM]|uniref:hypothetical protein n=1 Tax=Sporosarcina sp. ACRSM TaxID=2918216 RepID=UPI001EF44DF2|nr:hypothetical protein [Sporosarcina sp. ACRSM]MCG7335075.1 hypothetical protein [Sporosarcina sp. ACRSM]